MSEVMLNVASVRARTQTNGPGWRAAVWVQGCTIRCHGCFNPQTHPHQANRMWVPERLAERIVNPGVEGISILGGEPFEQAAACARLASRARELGATVVTYSGYTWEYLQRSSLPEVRALLAASDVLIAGPFVESRRSDARRWIGSSNQRVVLLTGRYVADDLDDRVSAPVVEGWVDGAVLAWSGILDGGDVVALGRLTAVHEHGQALTVLRGHAAAHSNDEERLCPPP